jgi:hypothetical protein
MIDCFILEAISGTQPDSASDEFLNRFPKRLRQHLKPYNWNRLMKRKLTP